MSRYRGLLLSLLITTAPNGFAYGQDAVDAIVKPTLNQSTRNEFRIPASLEKTEGGLKVVALDKHLPMALRPVDGTNRLFHLEVSDIITHVGGQPVTDVFGAFSLLRAQSGNNCLIRVRDKGGDAFDWLAEPRIVKAPLIAKTAEAPTGSRVFFIHVVATGDDRIGVQLKTNLVPMKNLVESSISEARLGSFIALTGTDCRARTLVDTISDLPLTHADTLCVYFQGHGGFDRRFEREDVSAGHFLDFGEVDFLRTDLVDAMLAKRARLTVLITDCCNVGVETDERYVGEARSVDVVGWTLLEELLLCYTGMVDLTSASRGNQSWCTKSQGSWFTNQFISHMNRRTANDQSWVANWNEIKTKSEAFYQEKRRKFGHLVPDLRQQVTMSAHEFILDVQRQNPPETPEGTRMIPYPVYRQLR